jgi:hypothetical protein
MGAYNQVKWPGVGDIDECWIIATYWALVAAGVTTRDQLPTIDAFRAAAGVPDRPGPTGGSYRNIMKALKKLFPYSGATTYVGYWQGFMSYMKKGYIASLFVYSVFLPKYLQFGFWGKHQVAVVMQGGKLFVMNPLAKEGSALLPITIGQLIVATMGRFTAVLFPLGGAQKPPAQQKFRPGPPRDLFPPLIQIDFYDPWKARRFYEERHREGTELGNLPPAELNEWLMETT